MSGRALEKPGVTRGTSLMLWVLWMTYGSFYFCRTNISAALPGIEAEFGLTKANLGWVLASLKIAYAAGQLVNGQLAERISPRKLLAVGMFVSAALNVLFGFGTAVYFWLFVWAANGYAQSLGWTPVIRVAANWIPVSTRGVRIGILGTSYQATAALTYLIAGFSAEALGWRAALWVPAALLLASGLHTWLLLEERPKDADVVRAAAPAPDLKLPIGTTFVRTVANPGLWFLAIALGLLNSTRYGFVDWGLSHIKEVQGTGVGSAALKYAVLPIGGAVGALFSGWVSDRFAGGRRAPVIVVLLLFLTVQALIYDWAVRSSVVGVIATLFLAGLAIYGAQVLLVGTFPVDLARPGTAAASVGLVNCMGYVGASAGDVVTGHLVDARGWQTAIYWWAGCALGAALIVALLWNKRATPSPGAS